jgi:hypothetical protein
VLINVVKPIPIYIGFDQLESVAYHVFEYSIQRHASGPVSVTPLRLSQLGEVLTRARHPLQSNDFSFSRWLVPYLSRYRGWSMFADCDMLCRDDLYRLWALRDPQYAVMVVKHNHNPVETVKYLGNAQTQYEKKNWSSVILFNNTRCKALTPEYINHASGLDLHQFKWLEDDSLIGSLPSHWNHLVGHDAPNSKAKIVHYTTGGPWLEAFNDCEFSHEWYAEKTMMEACEEWTKRQQYDANAGIDTKPKVG